MPKVEVNRESHRALIEEHWWEGVCGYEKVDVHCKLYRCDGGVRKGQYWAEAHIHKTGGGGIVISGGMPKVGELGWCDNPDEAIKEAVNRLEKRDDVNLK